MRSNRLALLTVCAGLVTAVPQSAFAQYAAGGGTATGPGSIAVGPLSSSTGNASVAVGANAVATQVGDTAVGVSAQATGANSSAFGNTSRATGGSSSAYGILSTASGVGSTAMGNGALASGESGTAIGNTSVASGDRSSSLGAFTSATGEWSTTVGTGSVATGVRSSALGTGATASHTNAAAIGWGATTTRADQIAIGSASATYTLSGVTSAQSRAAQSGQTFVLTTDAQGNVATASLATDASLEQVNGEISALKDDIARTNGRVDRATAGVAVALALAAPLSFEAGENFVMTANWGNFEGLNGFAISSAARLNSQLSINGGVGFAPGHGAVGTRAGVRVGW